MGSGQRRIDDGQAGPDETSNVVRIPRDWFGPKDELVPFGPRADESATARVLADAPPLDPNSFWGEDAGSVQDVLEAPDAPTAKPNRWRRRELVAGLAVAVIALLGLAAWLLEGSPEPRALPKVASMAGHEPRPVLPLQLAKISAARITERQARARDHERTRSKPRTKPPSQASEVVYRFSQGGSTTGASDLTPGRSAAATTPPPTSAGQSTAASTASATQSSQPTFGPGGVLGPMSSPDG